MTEIHAPQRAEHQSAGSPFAGYRPGDFVRDTVAVLVLLLALALPWSTADRGADRVEVVLATAVSLASLALPYLARFGALPASWTVQKTRRWRIWANAPAIAVVLVVVALDVANGSGVGTGAGLSAAGALLAATPRDSELGPPELDDRVHDQWRTVFAVAGGLIAAGALMSLGQPFLSDRELGPMLRAPLGFALVAGLLLLLVRTTWSHDRAARLVLLALGVVLTVLAVFTSGGSLSGVESTHGQRFGLVLFPALAALAAAPAVRRSPLWAAPGPSPVPGAVDVWVRVAIRAFQALLLVAACSAARGLVSLIVDGFDLAPLLRLILGLVIAGIAGFGGRALRRDTSNGHVAAVGAACVTGVLGLVVVVATSGGGVGVRFVDLVMALGLPGIAASALMVPKAVREHFQTSGIAGDGAVDHSPSWIWAPPAGVGPVTLPENPARKPEQIPTGGTHVAANAPGDDATQVAPVAQDAPATQSAPAAWSNAAAQAAAAQGAAGESGEDTTAVLHPASDGTRTTGSAETPSDSGSVPATPDRPRKRVTSTGAIRTAAGQEHRASSGAQPSVSRTAQERTARDMPGVAPGQNAPGQNGVHETAVMQPVASGAQPAVEHATEATLVGHAVPSAPPQQSGWTPEAALDPRTALADLAVIVQEAPHLRPHVARNPATYPALLDWLGALGDPDVDAALRSRR